MTFETIYTKHEPMHVVCVRKVINLLMPEFIGAVKNKRTGMIMWIELNNFIDPSMDNDFSGATKYEVVDEIINYLLSIPQLVQIQGAIKRLEFLREHTKYVLRNNYPWLS